MSNKQTETMNSEFQTLSALEQAVLIDILEEEKADRGFLSWDTARVFGKNVDTIKASTYRGAIASLQKKGVIVVNKFRIVKEISDIYRPA